MHFPPQISIFTAIIKNDTPFILQNPHLHLSTDKFGNTPMMLAAKLNKVQAIQILMQTSLKRENSMGQNALMIAVMNQQYESVQILLQEFDVNVKLSENVNDYCQNCDILSAALQGKNQQIYEIIKQKYIQVQQENIDISDSILMLKLQMTDQFKQNIKNVGISQIQSQLNLSKMLTQQNLSDQKNFNNTLNQNQIKKLSSIDAQSRNVWHYLATLNIEDLQLLQQLKDLKINNELEDNLQQTPLYTAIQQNSQNFIKQYLQLYQKPQKSPTKNPLILSIQQEKMQLVEQLYDIYQPLCDSNIPLLFHSCLNISNDIFLFLLKKSQQSKINLQIQSECSLKITVKPTQKAKLVLQKQAEKLKQNEIGNEIILHKDETITEFLMQIGDKAKLELLNMNQNQNSSMNTQNIQQLVNDTSMDQQQKQIMQETADLIQLMKKNQEKIKQEAEAKMDCLIQYYESRILDLENQLSKSESEKNELAELLAEMLSKKGIQVPNQNKIEKQLKQTESKDEKSSFKQVELNFEDLEK